MAFDTGPANMVIDACMEHFCAKRSTTTVPSLRRGTCHSRLYSTKFMTGAYFSAPPPKSCGREEFGASLRSRNCSHACKPPRPTKQDVVATATALTARTIPRRLPELLLAAPRATCTDRKATELIAAGGGTQEPDADADACRRASHLSASSLVDRERDCQWERRKPPHLRC